MQIPYLSSEQFPSRCVQVQPFPYLLSFSLFFLLTKAFRNTRMKNIENLGVIIFKIYMFLKSTRREKKK